MDLIIPHSLLTQYLKTNATPDEIARCLSLCGPTVDRLEKTADDWLYHIEVITNRVDAASVYGIAREAAAILPQFDHPASLMPLKLDDLKAQVTSTSLPPLDINIQNDPQLNHRIVALKLSAVAIKPSPAWLQSALIKQGQRPLNNIIDITNYVMFELGHPTHAFDYDRLTKKTIIVREAKRGETLVTLDNQTHTLVGGEIVYDDGTGTIIDLPGIMGTQNTVITAKTKNVLFWIESNYGAKIRFASLKHQIRSHAAILNEKNPGPELALPALLRAVQIAQTVTQAKISSQLTDIYPRKSNTKTVTLDLRWLTQFTGIAIPTKNIQQILLSLGFTLKTTADRIECQVPTWREPDISLPEDLAEEITRVYGYYRLPSAIPCTALPQTQTDSLLENEYQARLYLTAIGFTEIYNSPLISQSLCTQTGLDPNLLFRLNNPLSQDCEFMRSSLIPSLLQNVAHNLGTAAPPYRLLELANCYFKSGRGPLADEVSTLSLVYFPGHFLPLKGYIQALLRRFKLMPTYHPAKAVPAYVDPHTAADIEVNHQCVGHLGLLSTPVSQTFKLNQPVALCEIDFRALSSLIVNLYHFKPVPNFPAVIEDLTFTLKPHTHIGPVLQTVQAVHPSIDQVIYKTAFQNNLTLTVHYRETDTTITAGKVAKIRAAIVKTLQEKFQAQLVGNLQPS